VTEDRQVFHVDEIVVELHDVLELPPDSGKRVVCLQRKFPTQLNREFSEAYQGKFFKEQGIFTPDASILNFEQPQVISDPMAVDSTRGIPAHYLKMNQPAEPWRAYVNFDGSNRSTPRSSWDI
jgi:hypothetical protein